MYVSGLNQIFTYFRMNWLNCLKFKALQDKWQWLLKTDIQFLMIISDSLLEYKTI